MMGFPRWFQLNFPLPLRERLQNLELAPWQVLVFAGEGVSLGKRNPLTKFF